MALIAIPQEVLVNKIILNLPITSVIALRGVTKVVKDILEVYATFTYSDLGLTNNEISFTPGTLTKLFRYIQKRWIIGRNPTLFVQIDQARTNTVNAGGNPDAIKDLILHGGKEIGRLTPSLVVFDYESKQIKANGPNGLGAALCVAMCTDDEELIEAIFLHPNVKDMKPDDHGIVLCIDKALETKNQTALKKLIALPETKKLKLNFGPDSVGSLVCRAAKTNDSGMLQGILAIPKAKDVRVSFLEESLITAVNNDNAEMVTLLLDQPNATKINPSALDSAIRQATGPNKNAVIDAIVNGTSPAKLSLLTSVRELATQE